MFDTILIANRGEIACRVIRTARRMGLGTVAIFSDADRDALHVAMADRAVHVGPAPARESYLDIGRIIEAARRGGAQAIHPGYGFLSENAEFAEACAEAGLVFIGPPPQAIRAMGSKAAAKAAMERAGVPLVPGYHGEDQDPARLLAEAGRVGYPVLIKASAGGGGKGMRVAADPAGFEEALALARGEAASAFGDDRVLIERYLTRPRHIEIQVFADSQGHTVSLFERDCSIQRRHQKVVEEAPAPLVDPARRAAMGEAACAAARAIGYVGAGTVEFIAENESFYFMEMNTRLQVEHPVTEMVTGLDLVEWQLRVAAGEPLPPAPDAPSGHAIEVRIYAEDPARDFMPAIGRIERLASPPEGPGLRIDTGVREGDQVSIHYDPMIAKLIVHAPTREQAVRRLRGALDRYQVLGPATNLGLLRRIAAEPDFMAARLDTGFIERHRDTLLAPPPPAPAAVLAAAAAHVARRPAQAAAGDPWSPWARLGPFRLNGPGRIDVTLDQDQDRHTLALSGGEGGVLSLEGVAVAPDGAVTLPDGVVRHPALVEAGATMEVLLDGQSWRFTRVDPLSAPASVSEGADRVAAPMPGRIVQILVAPGQSVTRGEVLVVLEAMKVQMRLTAPRDGVIEAVLAAPGALVDEGVELVTYAEAPAA